MRILVTGGSGFLGRHMVARLRELGHAVRILDISDAPWRPTDIDFVPGTTTDERTLKDAVSECNAVVHLASTTIPKTSNNDPQLDAKSNLVGTLMLLDASVSAGVRRVVFASSGGTVYGETHKAKVDESHLTDPICAYGIVKLAVEKYLTLYHRLHGLESVSLRISNLYGEHQRPDTGLGVITSFCHKAIANEPLEVWGDGTVSRDFVYVGDVVDAFVRALQCDVACLTANVGSGTSVSLNTIIEIISRLMHREVETRFVAARSFDVKRTCLDVGLAERVLGWRPETSLETGISRVIEAIPQASVDAPPKGLEQRKSR